MSIRPQDPPKVLYYIVDEGINSFYFMKCFFDADSEILIRSEAVVIGDEDIDDVIEMLQNRKKDKQKVNNQDKSTAQVKQFKPRIVK